MPWVRPRAAAADLTLLGAASRKEDLRHYQQLVHFVGGWLLLAIVLVRVAGLFLASNRFQRCDALFPVKPRDLKNLFQVTLNYLLCHFDRGPHYLGHNPLQQVA